MTIQLQKVQYKYGNATVQYKTIQLQKVQYKYGNDNCKKYNIRMTIQLQKVQYDV